MKALLIALLAFGLAFGTIGCGKRDTAAKPPVAPKTGTGTTPDTKALDTKATDTKAPDTKTTDLKAPSTKAPDAKTVAPKVKPDDEDEPDTEE